MAHRGKTCPTFDKQHRKTIIFQSLKFYAKMKHLLYAQDMNELIYMVDRMGIKTGEMGATKAILKSLLK